MIVAAVVAGVVGWRHSARTRRLVTFAVLLILGLAAFVAASVLVRIYLFPVPPV